MRNAAAMFFALALAACGSGSGTTMPRAQSSGSNAQSVAVSINIAVPQVATASSTARRPAYVSTATASASITVAAGSGNPGAPTVVNCSSVCSAQINAPLGTDTFAVNLYSGASASGSLLATGTATQPIVIDQANAVNLTFNGVVASLAVAIASSVTAGIPNAALGVTISALDAAGKTLVGPGSFVNATGAPLTVALTNSDTSGATTLSQSSFAAPTSGVVMAFTGKHITNPTISASAAGLNTATAILTINGASQTFSYTGADQNFIVPPGIQSLTISAEGGSATGSAGRSATLTVTIPARAPTLFAPGDSLTIVVAALGVFGGASPLYSGGGRSTFSNGGGGASAVTDTSIATTFVVAGGPGGAGALGVHGGDAGNPSASVGIAVAGGMMFPGTDGQSLGTLAAGLGQGGGGGGVTGGAAGSENLSCGIGTAATAGANSSAASIAAGGSGGDVLSVGDDGGSGGGGYTGGGGGGAVGQGCLFPGRDGGGGGGSSFYATGATGVSASSLSIPIPGQVIISW